MRRAVLTGHFLLCSLALALAQGAPPLPPYPGDSAPGDDWSPTGAYVALRGSLTFGGKGPTVSVPTTPTATALRPAHDVGGGGAIALGVELPFDLRLEAEGLYHNRPVQTVTLGGVTAAGNGSLQTAATMANLVWAPQVDGFPIRPLIGGGAGMAYTYGQASDLSGANVYLQNGGWHFAWQGMAGLEIPVLPGASLTAMYRWMHTGNVKSKCGVAGAPALSCTKIGFDDQGVDLGLKIELP